MGGKRVAAAMAGLAYWHAANGSAGKTARICWRVMLESGGGVTETAQVEGVMRGAARASEWEWWLVVANWGVVERSGYVRGCGVVDALAAYARRC